MVNHDNLGNGYVNGARKVDSDEADAVKREERRGMRDTRTALRTAAGLPRRVKGRLVFPTAEERALALADLNAIREAAGLRPVEAPKVASEAPVQPPTVVNSPAE